MAHPEQIEFCLSVKAQFPEIFRDVFVLDIGSLDVNGNNQYLFENALYLGIDIALGRNVDIVTTGHGLMLPDATFDVVISTECLEHDQFWPETLRNACRLLKPGGLFLMTCATHGRQEHGTRRMAPEAAPLLAGHGDWQDYYRNLSEADIRSAIDVDLVFSAHRFAVNDAAHDLSFWGRKHGVLTKRTDQSFQIAPRTARLSARSPAPGGGPPRRLGAVQPGASAKDPTRGVVPKSAPIWPGGREIVEILSPFDSTEAVQRLKIDTLVRFQAGSFDFRPFGAGGDATAVVLINSLNIDFDADPRVWAALQRRAHHAVIMAFVADLGPRAAETMQKYATVVDVFLVPTPELRSYFSAFTLRRVECLFDPIDFCLSDSIARPPRRGPLRLVWFGYPESYRRSIAACEPCLTALHQQGMIEFHIVTKNERYGVTPSCVIHEYVPDQFLALLATFDACVVSHAPLDLSVSTLWKSENKAVLAINRGLPTVASRTPAYERLLEACGLGEYLYTTSDDLIAALQRLTSWSERHRYLAASQDYVLETYAPRRMADVWHQIYAAARARKVAQAGPVPAPAPIHLGY